MPTATRPHGNNAESLIREPILAAPTPAEGLQPGFRVTINDGPQGCEWRRARPRACVCVCV